MSGNNVESLLGEVESISEELSGALQKMAGFETHQTHVIELNEVIETLTEVQCWIRYRKNALNIERDRLADQIIANELSSYEAKIGLSKTQGAQSRSFIKDWL